MHVLSGESLFIQWLLHVASTADSGKLEFSDLWPCSMAGFGAQCLAPAPRFKSQLC